MNCDACGREMIKKDERYVCTNCGAWKSLEDQTVKADGGSMMQNYDDFNQTVKADEGKLKLTLVPRQIIKDICEVREYGNAKYPEGGPDNWKQVDIQRYRDALFRHFLAYLDDPHGVDEESGIEHYKHMACNMAFLCEMEKKR